MHPYGLSTNKSLNLVALPLSLPSPASAAAALTEITRLPPQSGGERAAGAKSAGGARDSGPADDPTTSAGRSWEPVQRLGQGIASSRTPSSNRRTSNCRLPLFSHPLPPPRADGNSGLSEGHSPGAVLPRSATVTRALYRAPHTTRDPRGKCAVSPRRGPSPDPVICLPPPVLHASSTSHQTSGHRAAFCKRQEKEGREKGRKEARKGGLQTGIKCAAAFRNLLGWRKTI